MMRSRRTLLTAVLGFAACFLAGTLAVIGCREAEAPEEPESPVAWCAMSTVHYDAVLASYYYLSWPDGGSLAIVVPFLRSGIHSPPLNPQDIQFVFVSQKEGVIYQNHDPILEFPAADNRCYIFGSDYRLHDSGQSAEWLCWISGHEDCMRGGGDEQQEPPGMLDAGPIPDRLLQEEEAFEMKLGSLAFGGDTKYCAPWDIADADIENGPVTRDEPVSKPWEFHRKWDTRIIYERPRSWRSSQPRDDWSVYAEDEPQQPIDPAAPVL